jgi:hypothetical protein
MHMPPLRRGLAGLAILVCAALSGTGAQAQNGPDYCYTYANEIVASFLRGQQANCGTFRNLNMNWEMHFQWCSSQPRKRVEDARSDTTAKLDGCLFSTQGGGAPPPPPQQQAAPRPPQGAPAGGRGKSFYIVAEGADEPSLCVDIAGGKIAPATPIMLWKCHGQAPQKFVLDPRNGRIRLGSNTGLCVDGVKNQQLLVTPCDMVVNDWLYDEKSSTVRTSSGLCWDIRGGNQPQNIRMRQQILAWPCYGGINQKFVFND